MEVKLGTANHGQLRFNPQQPVVIAFKNADNTPARVGVLFLVEGDLIAGGIVEGKQDLLGSAWVMQDLTKSLPEILAAAPVRQIAVPAEAVKVIQAAIDRNAVRAAQALQGMQQRHRGVLDGLAAQTRAIMGREG